ncbi:uncharacterized protein SAPINGB_P001730 [Magnusiomyces paraingens]|uniref:Uncharacterized protein n=1 Tax=Magnusiomyces paraingens TaxID=2606893 RepID=A0A5E8B9B5_9ASCO|nr:uncharacterized protein SAPINGB_P001730 [Saprochaete ingens]VVT47476.1 unnamed protein product [Saprochaete ingens]
MSNTNEAIQALSNIFPGFSSKFPDSLKMDQLRLDEWIKWAASIINDQSWIKKVTNPNSKRIIFKKEYKKYSSGIGNMISGNMSFTNVSRIEDYHEWKREIQSRVTS